MVKCKMYSEEVDAEDDEIISDSLGGGAQGTKYCILNNTAILATLAITEPHAYGQSIPPNVILEWIS